MTTPSSTLNRSSGEAYTQEEILAAISEEGGVPEGQVEVAKREAALESRKSKAGPGRSCVRDRQYVSGEASADNKFRWNEQDIPQYFAGHYKQEKWEHRIIAFLRAQGHSGVEIAKITGYSKAAIYQVLQLPWVKEVIAEEISRSGREAVQELLQVEAHENIDFLISVRNNEKLQTRDRITAAKELLDRTYGKPNQPITHREEVDPSQLSDQELAKLINAGGRGN